LRLAKYLAHAGVASRRAAERLIADGRVTLDGETVTDPARDADDDRDIRVDGRRVTTQGHAHEVYVLNKPAGVVSTARDPQGRRTVVELIPSRERLYPFGRLDADTTGLILLTNDGALAERLMHPRYEVPRTYRASVEGDPSAGALRTLAEGVELDDGPTAPAQVRRLGDCRLELTLTEGRNRQVRRMCEAVGHRVRALERVALGDLRLEGLEQGASRRLTPDEIERLTESPP
jgi:23S rRNA pseudouridine2605 synthase